MLPATLQKAADTPDIAGKRGRFPIRPAVFDQFRSPRTAVFWNHDVTLHCPERSGSLLSFTAIPPGAGTWKSTINALVGDKLNTKPDSL